MCYDGLGIKKIYKNQVEIKANIFAETKLIWNFWHGPKRNDKNFTQFFYIKLKHDLHCDSVCTKIHINYLTNIFKMFCFL